MWSYAGTSHSSSEWGRLDGVGELPGNLGLEESSTNQDISSHKSTGPGLGLVPEILGVPLKTVHHGEGRPSALR